MIKDNISVFDFSLQYDYLREQADYYSDCSLISGTNAYCSDEAAEQLREEVNKALVIEKNNPKAPLDADGSWEKLETMPAGIHFIDSGNYHYMSLFFLERIPTDFTLLLIDNHTDMNENAFGDILSCGNWVRKALETLPHLKKVVMLGVKPQYFQEMKESLTSEGELAENPESENELFFINEPANKEKQFSIKYGGNSSVVKIIYASSINEISKGLIDTGSIYVSLDKDALSEGYAVTDWDQGELSLDDIKHIFAELNQHHILGIDICGDTKAGASLNHDINSKIIPYILES